MAPLFQREVVRQRLEAKQRELIAELMSHDGIRVVRAAEPIDDAILAIDRDMATTELERRSVLLRQVLDALARLKAGEYGWCVRCGVEIAAERLGAVPWTPHCRSCQEMAEREDRAELAPATPRTHGTTACVTPGGR